MSEFIKDNFNSSSPISAVKIHKRRSVNFQTPDTPNSKLLNSPQSCPKVNSDQIFPRKQATAFSFNNAGAITQALNNIALGDSPSKQKRRQKFFEGQAILSEIKELPLESMTFNQAKDTQILNSNNQTNQQVAENGSFKITENSNSQQINSPVSQQLYTENGNNPQEVVIEIPKEKDDAKVDQINSRTKCKLCKKSKNQKCQGETTEEQEGDEEYEGTGKSQEDIHNKSQALPNKEIEEVNEEEEEEENEEEKMIRICKCEEDCFVHKRCLISRTIYNKHTCRKCMTEATFETIRNTSWKILLNNYQSKKKEVVGIFRLFSLTVLFFTSYLAYFSYSLLEKVDSVQLLIQVCCLLSIAILFFYGLVFFLSKLDKLCLIQLKSSVSLKQISSVNNLNNNNNELVSPRTISSTTAMNLQQIPNQMHLINEKGILNNNSNTIQPPNGTVNQSNKPREIKLLSPHHFTLPSFESGISLKSINTPARFSLHINQERGGRQFFPKKQNTLNSEESPPDCKNDYQGDLHKNQNEIEAASIQFVTFQSKDQVITKKLIPKSSQQYGGCLKNGLQITASPHILPEIKLNNQASGTSSNSHTSSSGTNSNGSSNNHPSENRAQNEGELQKQDNFTSRFGAYSSINHKAVDPTAVALAHPNRYQQMRLALLSHKQHFQVTEQQDSSWNDTSETKDTKQKASFCSFRKNDSPTQLDQDISQNKVSVQITEVENNDFQNEAQQIKN